MNKVTFESEKNLSNNSQPGNAEFSTEQLVKELEKKNSKFEEALLEIEQLNKEVDALKKQNQHIKEYYLAGQDTGLVHREELEKCLPIVNQFLSESGLDEVEGFDQSVLIFVLDYALNLRKGLDDRVKQLTQENENLGSHIEALELQIESHKKEIEKIQNESLAKSVELEKSLNERSSVYDTETKTDLQQENGVSGKNSSKHSHSVSKKKIQELQRRFDELVTTYELKLNDIETLTMQVENLLFEKEAWTKEKQMSEKQKEALKLENGILRNQSEEKQTMYKDHLKTIVKNFFTGAVYGKE